VNSYVEEIAAIPKKIEITKNLDEEVSIF